MDAVSKGPGEQIVDERRVDRPESDGIGLRFGDRRIRVVDGIKDKQRFQAI